MEKIMNAENLASFAYVNDEICEKPIRGIVVDFYGLNNITISDFDTQTGEMYAEKGILYVTPYNNPWAWMNSQAVAYTDEIIDVLMEKHGLSENTPIVATGGSMGGQSALIYTRYAKRTPVACVTNCPVCDVVFHYTERRDLPRTLYSSLFHFDGTLDEALRSISPLHQIEHMPRIPYRIFHCTADKSVNIDAHSRTFVKAMEESGHRITLDTVEGRGHCKLTLAAKTKMEQYIILAIEEAEV